MGQLQDSGRQESGEDQERSTPNERHWRSQDGGKKDVQCIRRYRMENEETKCQSPNTPRFCPSQASKSEPTSKPRRRSHA